VHGQDDGASLGAAGALSARLRATLDATASWAFEQDQDLRYTWSAGPLAPAGAVGSDDRALFGRPEDAELLEALKARVLATGEPEALEVELALGGAPELFRVSLAPVLGPDGEPTGLAGALARQAVGNDAADLLNLVGHQLRNAMNPLRMSLQLMERRRAQGDARALEGLGTAVTSAERLTMLLEDMLDYTRTLHERPEVEMVPIAVEAALMQAVVRFRLLHPQAAERVHLPAPEADLAVRADPRRLVQLLVTVLDRAVRTSEATAPVRVTLTARESSVTLTITDQGLPLAGDPAKADDPLEWARLCMAVHRDEPPFTFAVARRLAEAMGGSLRIGSGPDGRGAEVQVNLPRSRSVTPAVGAPVSEPVSPRRVLVVDDDVGAADALRRLLEAEGHTVAVARSGEECLARAAEGPLDVVVLDLGLPDVPGYEVARRLREARGPALRLVALTGRSSEEDRRRSLAAGFDQHVTKPATLDELRRALVGAKG